MNNTISIIIPVYNGENYISETIKSLLNQTYNDLDIIIINDYSTDNTITIIKELIKKDKRFRIIKPSKKLGNAVKGQVYGLNYCKGFYYFFMSQDDLIDNDFFEKCYNKMTETNSEIVIPNCILFYDDNSINQRLGKFPLNGDYESVIDQKEAFLQSLDWNIHCFNFKKLSFVKSVGLKDDYYNSEEYYNRISFLAANKIVFADTNFYYRQNNANAITKTIKYFHIDIVLTDLFLYKKLIENKFDKKICTIRLIKITKEYLGWFKIIYKNKFFRVNNFYDIRMMIKIFNILALEWIKLIIY